MAPDPDLILETAVVSAPRLRRRLRIVVVTHRHTRGLAGLFSTDLDLDPAGLTHCQARDVNALTFHINASLTAVSLNKLQAVQTRGQLPVPFSMTSIVRRCFNEYFIKKILACLADGQSLTENSPAYETLCNHGIIHPVAAGKLSELLAYKDQQKGERGFRFLKDPLGSVLELDIILF